MNLDTIGYVWTGEFDLNTLRVDGEIFESRKEKVANSKISRYVWTEPSFEGNFLRFVRARADMRMLMTRKSCTVGMRNAILGNQAKHTTLINESNVV